MEHGLEQEGLGDSDGQVHRARTRRGHAGDSEAQPSGAGLPSLRMVRRVGWPTVRAAACWYATDVIEYPSVSTSCIHLVDSDS
jgi:hypothetical protein